MRFIIVTGMSGAGKSTVLKQLEDMDYFCVDNLPVMLIKKFAEISEAVRLLKSLVLSCLISEKVNLITKLYILMQPTRFLLRDIRKPEESILLLTGAGLKMALPKSEQG